jgi:ATP-dependent exoDNAse (exonuclease V) alpha subunit
LRDAIESNKVPHYRDWMRFIKPRGAEQIVYGDKVICVRNHKRASYIHETKSTGEKEFLANGEIGMIIGQMLYGKASPSFTHIEFAGRQDRNFSFTRSAFSEDGQPYLELAYAITVHKAQGSEFGVVMLILPSYSRLVSREMLYTALTRQKRRIWILHQGPFDKFLSLRQYVFSDIAGAIRTCSTRRIFRHRGLWPMYRWALKDRKEDFLKSASSIAPFAARW